MKKHPEKSDISMFEAKWVITGMICMSRKWNLRKAYSFEISFRAFPANAEKKALECLKSFTNKERGLASINKFAMSSVEVRSGSQAFRVNGPFCNNSIHYAKRTRLVFEKVVS